MPGLDPEPIPIPRFAWSKAVASGWSEGATRSGAYPFAAARLDRKKDSPSSEILRSID